jgi:hypothetical protein
MRVVMRVSLMGMEAEEPIDLNYGPESRAPKRSLEQIKYERALSSGDGPYDIGFHNENLYDQDEGAGGDVVDLRTGEPIDNSTMTDAKIAGGGDGFIVGELPPIDDDDEAARWIAQKLAENGGQEDERKLDEAA